MPPEPRTIPNWIRERVCYKGVRCIICDDDREIECDHVDDDYPNNPRRCARASSPWHEASSRGRRRPRTRCPTRSCAQSIRGAGWHCLRRWGGRRGRGWGAATRARHCPLRRPSRRTWAGCGWRRRRATAAATRANPSLNRNVVSSSGIGASCRRRRANGCLTPLPPSIRLTKR